MIIYIIIAWVILAFVTGVIASSIGRNFFGYFFLSLITSPVLSLIILCIFGRSEKEQALRELRITAEIEEIKKQQKKVAQETEDEASQAQTTTETSSNTTDDDWASSLGIVGIILFIFALMCLGCYLYC